MDEEKINVRVETNSDKKIPQVDAPTEEKINIRVETDPGKDIEIVDQMADEFLAEEQKSDVDAAAESSAVTVDSDKTSISEDADDSSQQQTVADLSVDGNNAVSDDGGIEEIVSPEDSSLETQEDHAPQQPEAIAASFAAASKSNPKSFKQKLARPFIWWWKTTPVRYGSFAALLLLFAASVLMPAPRYFILNTAGVRVESSIQILNKDGALPIENIPVVLQGQEGRTNKDGMVYFSDLKLGSSKLIVDKRGYSQIDRDLVLGWGSNPLGHQSLEITGTQYEITFVDWLSGKPVEDVKVISGEDIAHSDETGTALLVSADAGSELIAEATSNSYRTEKIMLSDAVEDDFEVKLVLARKHTFVSKRSGQYDLYKIDLDGKNEEILLASTGKERELPFISQHKSGNKIAYISTRDGETNSGNFVLDGLFIIDVETGSYDRIARSEQMQIIGWNGDVLVYVVVVEGVSAGNPQRSRIISYDTRTTDKIELASSNYFNDVDLFNGDVYYSVAKYAVPASAAKLFSITTDGSNLRTVLDKQVWTVYRADYDKLVYNAVGSEWYEHISGSEPSMLDSPLYSSVSRVYSVSPDKKSAIWTTTRDGKGVIIKRDIESKQEQAVYTAPGVGSPAFWASNHAVVYRISTDQETADYVLSLDGGEPQKIADVQENLSRYFY